MKMKKVKMWNGSDFPIYFLDPGGKDFRPIFFLERDGEMIQLGRSGSRMRFRQSPVEVEAGRALLCLWRDVKCNFCGEKHPAILCYQVEPHIVVCTCCNSSVNARAPVDRLEKYFTGEK